MLMNFMIELKFVPPSPQMTLYWVPQVIIVWLLPGLSKCLALVLEYQSLLLEREES